jgi:hypothetical protein
MQHRCSKPRTRPCEGTGRLRRGRRPISNRSSRLQTPATRCKPLSPSSGAEGQWFESTVARHRMGRNLLRFLGRSERG